RRSACTKRWVTSSKDAWRSECRTPPACSPTTWRWASSSRAEMKLILHPLTPARWPDLETVFTARGCSEARRCWCMYYRVSGKGGYTRPGDAQPALAKAALRELADRDPAPGPV